MRLLFTVFLAFILIGCQAAPAAAPTASPTTSSGETPLPAATATLAPTSTVIPTPTVSPAELKRRAAPICENSFSALVESGSLLPPFAVMKKAMHADAPSWELSHQLPHLGSFSAADVRTLFCISETRTQAGTYTDGSAAYQLFWEVRIVSWPGGKVIGKNSFTGSPPPETKVFSSSSAEGSFPYSQFATWIFNQVDHPDFLYFNDAITSLAISPDGHNAAFGTAIANQIVDKDYQAKIFLFNPSDLQTDMGTSAFLNAIEGHQGMVTSLAFSPDGKTLASSGYDLFIKFWDVTSGRLLGQISLADTPNSLLFSPDGDQLAVASNLEVAFVDADSMQVKQSVPETSVRALAFSPDGSHLYVHSSKRLKIIDVNANRVTLEFPDPLTLIPTISVAEDGSLTGVTYATPDTIDNFVLSPNGTQVITYSVDPLIDSHSGKENIRLATWDASTGKYISEVRAVGDSVRAMKVSPDGNLMAIGNDSEIGVWDIATWQIVKNFSGHMGLIEALTFTPDGTKILSAGHDSTVRVWSLDE